MEKLWEDIYNKANKRKVETEEQLKTLLDEGVEIEAKHTGPFGENTGAKVIGFGKIKDLHKKMKGIEWVMDEEGYDEDAYIEDWLADNEEATVVVLDQLIGQGSCNFYTLDAYTVEDLDLWVKK